MQRKVLIQGIASGVAIPVVCVGTYLIASRNASVDVASLKPPVVSTTTPTPTPTPEETEAPAPEPSTQGGGSVVVTPPRVVPQPPVVPVPATSPATAPVVEPSTATTTHTPVAPRTTKPAPQPASTPLVTKYGKAHILYVYQGTAGPRPTSCSGWVPKITLTDLYGGQRTATVTKGVLSFPDNPKPTDQSVFRFVCDWSFVGSVPKGLDYSVSAKVPTRPDVLVMMAPQGTWVFPASTNDPYTTFGVLLSFIR
jgi:hypothetical protein